MPVSKKFTWTDKNGESIVVELGADGANVDINGEALSTVISALQDASNKSLKYIGNVDSTKSVNDYNTDTAFGIWHIGAGYTVADMPIGRVANENVLLIVSKAYSDDTYCKQELIYTTQNIILTRLYNGSNWSEWKTSVVASPAKKTGGKIVTFANGSNELIESEYEPDKFLRKDIVNKVGEFNNLSVLYPKALSVSDAANAFAGGTYYDARTLSGKDTVWEPVTGNGGMCSFTGEFDFSHPYKINSKSGKVLLPDVFNNVDYCSSANNEFKFKIGVIIDITRDTTSRDIISLFNGNLSVNRRGMNGLRIVAKQGANGTSLKTSNWIADTGLMVLCFEGSNNTGTINLSIYRLGDDFISESPNPDAEVTLELTAPVYMGNTKSNSYINAVDTLYSLYFTTSEGTDELTFSEPGIDMQTMFRGEQTNVATVGDIASVAADVASVLNKFNSLDSAIESKVTKANVPDYTGKQSIDYFDNEKTEPYISISNVNDEWFYIKPLLSSNDDLTSYSNYMINGDFYPFHDFITEKKTLLKIGEGVFIKIDSSAQKFYVVKADTTGIDYITALMGEIKKKPEANSQFNVPFVTCNAAAADPIKQIHIPDIRSITDDNGGLKDGTMILVRFMQMVEVTDGVSQSPAIQIDNFETTELYPLSLNGIDDLSVCGTWFNEGDCVIGNNDIVLLIYSKDTDVFRVVNPTTADTAGTARYSGIDHFDLDTLGNIADLNTGIMNGNKNDPLPPSTLVEAINDVDSKISDGHNYSTTPQQIGTWIDGTPIWRIAFDKDADLSLPKYYMTDEKMISIHYREFVSVKNWDKFAVIDGQVFLRVGSPCAIDDWSTSRHDDSWECETTSPSSRDGFYGWIEFITPENNIITV